MANRAARPRIRGAGRMAWRISVASVKRSAPRRQRDPPPFPAKPALPRAGLCGIVRKCEGELSETADHELSDEQSQRLALRVREELAARRISRQRLADDARISLSTLEKALAGRRPFTLATLIRLEQALGARLRAVEPAESGQAPDSLGAYTRARAYRLARRRLPDAPALVREHQRRLRLPDRDRLGCGRSLPRLPGGRAHWTRPSPSAARSRCPTSPATSIW